MKRPVLHPRRRERRGRKGSSRVGGRRMGVEGKRPGSRVGEDGQAWWGKRETPTKREKEREQKTP